MTIRVMPGESCSVPTCHRSLQKDPLTATDSLKDYGPIAWFWAGIKKPTRRPASLFPVALLLVEVELNTQLDFPQGADFAKTINVLIVESVERIFTPGGE